MLYSFLLGLAIIFCKQTIIYKLEFTVVRSSKIPTWMDLPKHEAITVFEVIVPCFDKSISNCLVFEALRVETTFVGF